jgi:type I restriction enzyme M protein
VTPLDRACFETGRHQNQLRPQDIDAILSAYESGNDGESVPVRLVERAEITENGWDLKVGRYLTIARAESITVE